LHAYLLPNSCLVESKIYAEVLGALHNKAKQQQSLRSLDSLVAARFVRGCATIAQTNHQQACRCWRR
jgi:hypothetical protein